MAIFGLFRKDKSKASSSQASTSSVVTEDRSAEDYVLSPPSLSLSGIGHGDDGYASSTPSFVSNASSKKMRLPFSKKPSQSPSSPLVRPLDIPRNLSDFSNNKHSLSLDTSPLDLPHSPVFPSFHQYNSSPTLVQPEPKDSRSRPQPTVLQKSEPSSKTNGGLFGWRERKKSKPSNPEIETLVLPPLSDDSFNLKSFRHVLPEPSRSTSPQNCLPAKSPSPTSLLPPARPRGASVASTDSSQRISVAAFREAQARRSSTNLVNGSPSPTIRPISLANSVISDTVPPRPPRSLNPPISDSPTPTNGRPQTFHSSSAISSSDATSSDESDSESSSRSRPRSRLSRQHTITKRSQGTRSDAGHDSSRLINRSQQQQQQQQQQAAWTRSEHGHASPRLAHPSPSRGPPPSSFQKTTDGFTGTRSISIYRRERASYSTSELNPNAAAQRANTLAQANLREAQGSQIGGDSDTSDSSSDSDSSDEDAPLSSLKQPRRPGSNISHSSFASPRKPLIDLNLKSNPITGKPVDMPAETPLSRPNLMSPTNINGRLANLTAQAGLNNHRSINNSKSEANLSKMAIPRPSFVNSAKPDSPASTETVTPPPLTKSPEPMSPTQLKGLASPLDSNRMKPTDRPIPVKDRVERNTGFRVVSRPEKSATSPPSSNSSAYTSSNQSQQRPTAVSHHRHSSSSFTVTSRPLSGGDTKPLVDLSRPRASTSGSASNYSASASGSGSGSGQFSPTRSTFQVTPQRPFVLANKRQDSPASSTGGSSNGKGPLTPMDGSDYFVPAVRSSGDSPSGSSLNATPPSALKGGRGGHVKRASVTFQDQLETDKDNTVRGRRTSMGSSKTNEQGLLEERETRLKERRRSEAKAAIELGKVINGNGPVEVDDDDDPILRGGMPPQLPHMAMGGGGLGLNFNNMQMSWQQQGLASPMLGPMNPINGMKGAQGMGMNLNMQQFMISPPPQGADAAYLAAHQQAMAIAKQAYQYAVAQQAMAAAADEWERGSSISAFAPSGGGMGMGMNMPNMGMGGFGMGGMNPMGGMNGMNGMGGMWGGGGQMFPAAPRSMYAGSMGGAMSEAGWGASSVYGESFGPSVSANARRSQILGGNVRDSVVFPGGSANPQPVSSPGRNTNNPRPRTRTAPSNGPLPAQHRQSKFGGPPSSWKA